MIGNDVIDLVKSRNDSNWRRQGFVSKLFNTHERILIENSQNPEIEVWLLWSMKEAAYKIWNRQTGIRMYMPKRLRCSVIESSPCYAVGEVACEGNRYYTETFICSDFIHTIAVEELIYLEHILEITRDEISKDSFGIPGISIKDQNVVLPVSVSNHGRFERIVTIKKL
ncbi:4'-phosphopantetheinyl transferase superfamily protein [Sphingobacterium sp. 2149]|uniref:4'-phosphopantetheinyl transferase family protein n=1 Tax=Sphingobacterium sp. 2149 TaxID=2817763 RepID=UPI001AE441A0|nr:4'-phosphopantetheinyl transferase superfamily protein [Sphingobacterium sp. 2149]MDR6733336.1 hypothetical protein [Sphingobacterium sp. 2149]